MRHIPAFLTAGELPLAQAFCSRLLTTESPPPSIIPYFSAASSGTQLVRVERFVEDFEVSTRIPLLKRAATIAAQLLGCASVALFKDKINFRHPGSEGFGPHQDAAAGWDKYSPYFVSVAIFIRNSNPQAGGFEFAVNAKPNFYYPAQNGKLLQSDFDGFQRTPIVCPAGDAIAFDSYAPHQSYRNGTEEVVPHIILTFNDASHGSHRDKYYSEKVNSMSVGGGPIRFRVFEFGDEYAK